MGYWRLGETSGTTAYDISGNAINGTYAGVTLAQTGALSGDSDTAAYFDGANSIVDLGNTAQLTNVFNAGNKWTVSLWFKTAQLNANGPWLFSKAFTSHTSPYYQFDIRQSADGSISAGLWRSDIFGSAMGAASAVIPTGVWTHLAVTVDLATISAASMKLYINGGTPVTSTADLTGIYSNIASFVTIGANKNLSPNTAYTYNGLIDEVAIYPTALSAARILTLYNAGLHPDRPLVFNGSTSNSYVDFGTGVNNNADFSFETWIKPANAAATGKVILSNGTTTNWGASNETDTGLTIRQSGTYPGKLELYLGEKAEQSYSQAVLADNPVGYWRLNETSGTSASDSSGNAQTGTYTNSPTLGQTGAYSSVDSNVHSVL
ncbi:MAG: LamG domain-containing protein, partial [Deltaproteobacteria bacterium]|nr:LamG domain-containing protein [Deltaproteobacteria bacterium]